MAKFAHITQSFGSSTTLVSRTSPTAIQTHTAPNLPTDTLARTILQFHMGVVIDPTGNPPPIEWWQTARMTLCMAYNANGSGSAPASENDPSIKARWMMYPTPWYDLATNDLYGVLFQPKETILETTTRHKGDGVNSAKLIWWLFMNDANHAVTNPGGTYSLTSSFAVYTKAIWESDT